jgi:FKBP-type peptidyl-prolyl cis-trans isomerase (trigger factor)
MAVALTACGSNGESAQSNNDNKTTKEQTEQQDPKKQMEEMQKKLDEQKVDEKKTVAIVNDEKIVGSDYNMALSSSQMQLQQMGQDPTSKEAAEQVKKQTIDNLVGQILVLQEADKKGYKASEDEVKMKLDEAKKQYKTDKEFEAAIKQANLDITELESEIAKTIKTTKYVENEIPIDAVTDEEIQTYYDQAAKQGNSSGQPLPKLEEVKPQIKQQLEQQKKQEKLMKQVEELKKNAKVDVKI